MGVNILGKHSRNMLFYLLHNPCSIKKPNGVPTLPNECPPLSINTHVDTMKDGASRKIMAEKLGVWEWPGQEGYAPCLPSQPRKEDERQELWVNHGPHFIKHNAHCHPLAKGGPAVGWNQA